LSAVAQVFFLPGFAAPLLPVGEFVVLCSFNSVSALAMVRRSLSDSPQRRPFSASSRTVLTPTRAGRPKKATGETAATICGALGIGRTTCSATSPTATRT